MLTLDQDLDPHVLGSRQSGPRLQTGPERLDTIPEVVERRAASNSRG
jgi:hypothetical protein